MPAMSVARFARGERAMTTTAADREMHAAAGPLRDPAIQVRGLHKSFKEVVALRGVDLEVARGSIVALLGPNGAGKTTVVKILSTLLRADAGTARVNGF